jgi:hypothetical protein
MAFLTKSNSLKIISRIDFRQIGNLQGQVYKNPIYCFSQWEENNLLGLKGLLKDPEKFINEYYKPISVVDNLRYVYEGSRPAYHSKPDCDRLNSNFKNFEIPEEIRERGRTEVIIFRKWFKENAYLLEKPEVFVMRLQAAFGVLINPKAIDYENSGIEEKANLDLKQLEERIDQFISLAGRYYNESQPDKKEILRRFQKYTFLAYSRKEIYNNDTGLNDDELKEFLRQYDKSFKMPIKDLLIEYYRVQHNPELKFEGSLLEQLGFRPCSACHETQRTGPLASPQPENYLEDDDFPF